jgi:sugar lactone lactonase YvrE
MSVIIFLPGMTVHFQQSSDSETRHNLVLMVTHLIRVIAILSALLLSLVAKTAFATADDLYVGNLANAIFKIGPNGAVTQFATGFDPYGIAFNASGEAFAASSSAKKIVRLSSSGTVTNFVTGLGDPLGLAFGRDGNLYAADYTANTIWRIAPNGSKTAFATGIVHPDGIAFDPSGNLFVTGYSDGRLTKVAPNGTKTTFATGLIGPVGVACDRAGNVFVAERDGARISRFSPTGVKSLFLAGLSSPYGLAFDATGRLFASNQFSSTIYRVDANGTAAIFAHITGEAGFISFEPGIGVLQSVSTRAQVLTGDIVLIAGFTIGGTEAKNVLVRGLGPTLQDFGVQGALVDPTLALFQNSVQLAANDNWRNQQETVIAATGKAPPNNLEPAILRSLTPGNYTAILAGKNNTTGVGLIEVYDQGPANSAILKNISTRGFVGTDERVMIAGFAIGGGSKKVIVRALGPTLAQFGVPNVLQNPTLALFDGNGQKLASNDDWPNTQAGEIQASGLAPPNQLESAIIITRAAGNTTAIVSGKNGTSGNALVDVYTLPQ